MESKVTVTTLRFTDEELDKIDAVTGSGSKTRAGKLRHMISQYANLHDKIDLLSMQLEEKDSEVERLNEVVNMWKLRHEKLQEIWSALNTMLS